MTATAANVARIFIKATSPADVELDGINQFSIGLSRDMLDTTDFVGGAFRQRIAGLKDFPISFSGDFEPADAAYVLLRTAWTNGTTVFARILPDGTNGFEVECRVPNMEFSGSVDGKNEASFTLASTGDVTFVP
jgi:predicted secreted protein